MNTYNIRQSQVVTRPNHFGDFTGLSMGERTGSRISSTCARPCKKQGVWLHQYSWDLSEALTVHCPKMGELPTSQ
jgi:hypothetical protein